MLKSFIEIQVIKMGKPQSKEENQSGQQLVSIIENQNLHSEKHEEHSLKLTILVGLLIFLMVFIIIRIIRKLIKKRRGKSRSYG